MRIRVRWLIAVAVLTVFVSRMVDDWWSHFRLLAGQGDARRLGENFSRSQSYLVPKSGWVTFRIPTNGEVLRILTNGNLRENSRPEESAEDLRPSWRYAIRYQLLDSRQRDLEDTIYHFRTGLSEYIDDNTGKTYTAAFYADASVTPATTRAMHIPLHRLEQQASFLRLQLDTKDPDVEDVCVRIYCRQQCPGYDRPYTWLRTSARKKEKLCRASIYEPELLSRYERRNVLRWQWSPLAPRGIEGRNYGRRILYILDGVTDERVIDRETPYGLLVRPGLRGAIPLPSTYGDVHLVCSMENMKCEEVASLGVSWFGRGVHQRETHHYIIRQKESTFRLPTEGGLLEVESSSEVIIRAFWTPPNQLRHPDSLEITPTTNLLRHYVADSNHAIEYAISHVGECPTPFRISLRRLISPVSVLTQPPTGVGESMAEVHWEILDAKDEVLDSGVITADQPTSLYDRVVDGQRDLNATNAATYYFSLPVEARMIRFRGACEPVLLAGFTRPCRLPKTTRVPEDYLAFERAHGTQPGWFMVRPVDHLRLMQEDRTVTVQYRERPPEDDADIVAGCYTWEDYHPSGLWKARHLLTPRESAAPIRAAAALTTFAELPTNKTVAVRLLQQSGRIQIEPRLIYVNQGERASQLQVLLDGHLVHTATMHASRGEISLPPMHQDQQGQPQQIRVNVGQGVRVFINCVDVSGRPAFLKRLANRFDGQTIAFDYDKESPEEELLMLHVYQTGGQPSRSQMQLSISSSDPQTLGPFRSWTIKQRVYDFQPTETASIVVLGTDDEFVSDGRVCYLPLGHDLPPGRYRIQIQREISSRGYIVLSKTTPGEITTKRKVWYEPPAFGKTALRPN